MLPQVLDAAGDQAVRAGGAFRRRLDRRDLCGIGRAACPGPCHGRACPAIALVGSASYSRSMAAFFRRRPEHRQHRAHQD